MYIVLLILAVVVVAVVFVISGDRQVDKDTDASGAITAMMISKSLTDTTRRLNNWNKQRDWREKEKWAWQEKVRRENPSFNEHYNDDF